VDGDHVPDEPLQFIRRRPLLPAEECEIFAETHFVAVDLVGVEPDPVLRQFRVVVLGLQPVGIVVHADRAHQKPAGGNQDDRRGRDEAGDAGQASGQIFRHARGRRRGLGEGERSAGHDDAAEYQHPCEAHRGGL
jgi:hypothetical protein